MMRALLILVALMFADAAPAETLTAARLVRPQAVIVPDDLVLVDRSVPGALGVGDDIIGLEARVTLYPGRPILADHVGPPALIERNQPVLAIFRRGGLTILAEARALSRGAEGDLVKIMNLASRTTVSGFVQPDGSVLVSREANRK